MDFEQILEQILETLYEWAVRFFHYTMNVGENRFLLVDVDAVFNDNVPDEVKYYFIGSFLIVTLIAILASDSFKVLHPFAGIKEWPTKINVLKVTVFAAAVFSLHTFYKMLVTAIASLANDRLGDVMTNCLGSYINPISVCVMSIALTTVELKKKTAQAFFLALSIFVTPAILSYATFTNEHIAIYLVGFVLAIAAGILYRRYSMYVTYAIMAVVYLIGKFFLIEYSEQATIIDNSNYLFKVGQYLSCMRIDIGMIIVLLLILFIYKTVLEELDKKSVIQNISVVIVLLAVFIFSYPARMLFPIYPVVYARDYNETIFDKFGVKSSSEDAEEEVAKDKQYRQIPVVVTYVEESSYLVTKNGTEYNIYNTIDGDYGTCWQDGVKGDGIGETLRYGFDDAVISKMTIINGNRRDDKSYEENNRLASAHLLFRKDGRDVYEEDISFEDNGTITSVFEFVDGVDCDTIELTITDVYSGSKYKDTCVSEVHFTRFAEE